ncbi:hypothetical protein SCUP234_08398 [Seiridium cupressi]
MASSKKPRAPRIATKSSTPRIPPLPYNATPANASPAAAPTATAASTLKLPHSLRAPAPKQIDPSSPAYKAASRKYVGFMVAMPILLVTSYVLFDRLALGHEAKSLKKETTTVPIA